MASMKETSPGKVIDISINITVQITSMLILILSRLTVADWSCLGAKKYAISFENRITNGVLGKEKMEMRCTVSNELIRNKKYEVNPKVSFTFCGGWFVHPWINCGVSLSNSNWFRRFTAFDLGYHCKLERKCQWQIHKKHPFLYVPHLKKYVQQDYHWDPTF